ERLRPAAHLHGARAPRVGARQVVDADGASPAARDVAELLRARERAPADVDRVELRVVRPADRDDVRRPVGADGREAGEAATVAQVGQLGVAEGGAHEARLVIARSY